MIHWGEKSGFVQCRIFYLDPGASGKLLINICQLIVYFIINYSKNKWKTDFYNFGCILGVSVGRCGLFGLQPLWEWSHQNTFSLSFETLLIRSHQKPILRDPIQKKKNRFSILNFQQSNVLSNFQGFILTLVVRELRAWNRVSFLKVGGVSTLKSHFQTFFWKLKLHVEIKSHSLYLWRAFLFHDSKWLAIKSPKNFIKSSHSTSTHGKNQGENW